MMKRFILTLLLLLSTVFMTIAQEEEAPDDPPWWNERVFYEIFVRSFYDSDGDGIGDFNGMIEKLDYLNDGDPATNDDLGITGIWLMPIMPTVSYHGYDVIDYYNVNPEFGTMDDFKAFLDAAHERGIAVIIDLVINHTSSQHPWFIDSAENPDGEYADWYIWADEDPAFRGPGNNIVWHRRGDRYYFSAFFGGMPDLNLTNPEVTEEIYNIARFWLEDVGVDGFRLDAIKFLIEEGRAQENTASTFAWLTDFYAHVRSINPDAFVVGEIWDSTTLVAPYVHRDTVSAAFEFDLAGNLMRAARFGLINTLTNALIPTFEFFPPLQYATFLTNHDQDRVMSQLRDVEAAKRGATFLLTLPGIPFIYYGEEIGMTGAKPDELIRTPMLWDASPNAGFSTSDELTNLWQTLNEDYLTNNVEAQSDDADSLFNHYRALVQARNSVPALQIGGFQQVDSGHRKVLAFFRSKDEQSALVIINMHDRPVTEYALTAESSPLTGDETLTVALGEGEATAPDVGAEGAFDAYIPFAELATNSVTIVVFE